jgi:hypothetical protein
MSEVNEPLASMPNASIDLVIVDAKAYQALKARVTALEAENAELRAVLRELVDAGISREFHDGCDWLVCYGCRREARVVARECDGITSAEDIQHAPDCAIERARRLLARTGGGEGEG